MAHEFHCPHCGCPLRTVRDAVKVPELDTAETLRREIEHLRATVARLRGAGSHPHLSVPRQNHAAPNHPVTRKGSDRAG